MSDLSGILWCGCDDSNHRGEEGYEIILATFSLFEGDGVYQQFKNRRNCKRRERERIYTDAQNWMKDTVRDYRFAAIERERAIMNSNIPWVLPTLLRNYLENSPYDIENVQAYIDGLLKKEEKKNLLEEFSDFSDMKIYSIVKGRVGKERRRPKILTCPKVLWAADIWANKIYRLGEREILGHKKRIIIP